MASVEVGVSGLQTGPRLLTYRCSTRRRHTSEEGLGTQGSETSSSRTTTSTQPDTTASEAVEIVIQGKRLSVRTDRDADFVEELADYVDETIEAISGQVSNAPTDKVMLMAVMTIAEELFEAKRDHEELRRELKERAEAMDNVLDAWAG